MSRHLTGLPAWLVQRLSALYLLLFTLGAVLGWLLAAPVEYVVWRQWFSHPAIFIATAMFFLALLLHAWVGVRDVVLDYAGQRPWWRLVLLTLLGGWLIALGLWAIRILIMGVA